MVTWSTGGQASRSGPGTEGNLSREARTSMDVRIPRPRSGFCPWPMWDRKRLRLCLTLSLLGAVVGCQTTISATPSATPAPTITPFGTDRSPTPAPSSTVAVSPGPTGRHEVFELTGPTYEDDVQPAAALLKDGRVLLVGGSLPAAEIYEPATREFTITGPLLRDMVSPGCGDTRRRPGSGRRRWERG